MPRPPPPPPSSQWDYKTQDSEEEEDLFSDPVESPSSTHDSKSKKKTRRKKKSKKKKKTKDPSSSAAAAAAAAGKAADRSVEFGTVHVREYERCLGTDVVPVDGGWPLGMSDKVVDEYYPAESVDHFEERRQEELRRRYLEIMSNYLANSSTSSSGEDQKEDDFQPQLQLPTGVLETRQFDYKKQVHEITGSTKNPLFRPLSEEERMRLLVLESSEDPLLDPEPTAPNKTPPSGGGIRKQQRRPRSNSDQFSSHDSPATKSPSGKQRRLRSYSDQFCNETYTSAEVLHVRNELEQVRVQRSLEGSAGCSCRKLDVYIPPKGAGKKAQHRRMNPHKVKEELRKRAILPANHHKYTRAELEQMLHDAVEKEPCCWGNDCFCVRNGISCQADACSCWHGSHQRKGNAVTASEELTSVETIQKRCGNNMYVVDLDSIRAFRRQYVYCQVIETGEEEKTN